MLTTVLLGIFVAAVLLFAAVLVGRHSQSQEEAANQLNALFG